MESPQPSGFHEIHGRSPLRRLLTALLVSMLFPISTWLFFWLATNTPATSESFLLAWGLFGLSVVALPIVAGALGKMVRAYRQFERASLGLSVWPIPRGAVVTVHYQQPLKQPQTIRSIGATLICYEVMRRRLSDMTVDEAKAGAQLVTRKQLLHVPLEPIDLAAHESRSTPSIDRSWRFTIPNHAHATATINRVRYEWILTVSLQAPKLAQKLAHQPEQFTLVVT